MIGHIEKEKKENDSHYSINTLKENENLSQKLTDASVVQTGVKEAAQVKAEDVLRKKVIGKSLVQPDQKNGGYYYEHQSENNCYACSLSKIYNNLIKGENPALKDTLNQKKVRSFVPRYYSKEEWAKIDPQNTVGFEARKADMMLFAGEGKKEVGNAFAMADVIFDKKENGGLDRKNVAVHKMSFHLAAAKNGVVLGNLIEAMKEKLHEVLKTGQMVSVLRNMHYFTVVGLDGDNVKVLNSSNDPADVPMDFDIHDFLQCGEKDVYNTTELTWVSKIDAHSAEKLKKEYNGFGIDGVTGEVIRTNGILGEEDVAQRVGITIRKSPEEIEKEGNADIANYIADEVCLHRGAFMNHKQLLEWMEKDKEAWQKAKPPELNIIKKENASTEKKSETEEIKKPEAKKALKPAGTVASWLIPRYFHSDHLLFPKKDTLYGYGNDFDKSLKSDSERAKARKNKRSRLYKKTQLSKLLIKNSCSEKDELVARRRRVSLKDMMLLSDEDLENLSMFFYNEDEKNSSLIRKYAADDEEEKKGVMDELTGQFLNISFEKIDISDDNALVKNSAKLEGIALKLSAYNSLLKKNPSYIEALKNTKAPIGSMYELVQRRIDELGALSDYYRVRKLLLTNPYYLQHYNEEMSGVYYGESAKKKQVAELIGMSASIAKRLSVLLEDRAIGEKADTENMPREGITGWSEGKTESHIKKLEDKAKRRAFSEGTVNISACTQENLNSLIDEMRSLYDDYNFNIEDFRNMSPEFERAVKRKSPRYQKIVEFLRMNFAAGETEKIANADNKELMDEISKLRDAGNTDKKLKNWDDLLSFQDEEAGEKISFGPGLNREYSKLAWMAEDGLYGKEELAELIEGLNMQQWKEYDSSDPKIKAYAKDRYLKSMAKLHQLFFDRMMRMYSTYGKLMMQLPTPLLIAALGDSMDEFGKNLMTAGIMSDIITKLAVSVGEEKMSTLDYLVKKGYLTEEFAQQFKVLGNSISGQHMLAAKGCNDLFSLGLVSADEGNKELIARINIGEHEEYYESINKTIDMVPGPSLTERSQLEAWRMIRQMDDTDLRGLAANHENSNLEKLRTGRYANAILELRRHTSAFMTVDTGGHSNKYKIMQSRMKDLLGLLEHVNSIGGVTTHEEIQTVNKLYSDTINSIRTYLEGKDLNHPNEKYVERYKIAGRLEAFLESDLEGINADWARNYSEKNAEEFEKNVAEVLEDRFEAKSEKDLKEELAKRKKRIEKLGFNGYLDELFRKGNPDGKAVTRTEWEKIRGMERLKLSKNPLGAVPMLSDIMNQLELARLAERKKLESPNSYIIDQSGRQVLKADKAIALIKPLTDMQNALLAIAGISEDGDKKEKASDEAIEKARLAYKEALLQYEDAIKEYRAVDKAKITLSEEKDPETTIKMKTANTKLEKEAGEKEKKAEEEEKRVESIKNEKEKENARERANNAREEAEQAKKKALESKKNGVGTLEDIDEKAITAMLTEGEYSDYLLYTHREKIWQIYLKKREEDPDYASWKALALRANVMWCRRRGHDVEDALSDTALSEDKRAALEEERIKLKESGVIDEESESLLFSIRAKAQSAKFDTEDLRAQSRHYLFQNEWSKNSKRESKSGIMAALKGAYLGMMSGITRFFGWVFGESRTSRHGAVLYNQAKQGISMLPKKLEGLGESRVLYRGGKEDAAPPIDLGKYFPDKMKLSASSSLARIKDALKKESGAEHPEEVKKAVEALELYTKVRGVVTRDSYEMELAFYDKFMKSTDSFIKKFMAGKQKNDYNTPVISLLLSTRQELLSQGGGSLQNNVPREDIIDASKQTAVYLKKSLYNDLPESNMRHMPLFVHEPNLNDLKQGTVGNCFMHAAVQQIVSQDPQAIRDMFCDLGDGTVLVRFFAPFGETTKDGKKVFARLDDLKEYNSTKHTLRPVYVRVKKNYETGEGVSSDCMWMQLLETAYAACGFNTGVSSVEKDGELKGFDSELTSGSSSDVLFHMTGKTYFDADVDEFFTKGATEKTINENKRLEEVRKKTLFNGVPLFLHKQLYDLLQEMSRDIKHDFLDPKWEENTLIEHLNFIKVMQERIIEEEIDKAAKMAAEAKKPYPEAGLEKIIERLKRTYDFSAEDVTKTVLKNMGKLSETLIDTNSGVKSLETIIPEFTEGILRGDEAEELIDDLIFNSYEKYYNKDYMSTSDISKEADRKRLLKVKEGEEEEDFTEEEKDEIARRMEEAEERGEQIKNEEAQMAKETAYANKMLLEHNPGGVYTKKQMRILKHLREQISLGYRPSIATSTHALTALDIKLKDGRWFVLIRDPFNVYQKTYKKRSDGSIEKNERGFSDAIGLHTTVRKLGDYTETYFMGISWWELSDLSKELTIITTAGNQS